MLFNVCNKKYSGSLHSLLVTCTACGATSAADQIVVCNDTTILYNDEYAMYNSCSCQELSLFLDTVKHEVLTLDYSYQAQGEISPNFTSSSRGGDNKSNELLQICKIPYHIDKYGTLEAYSEIKNMGQISYSVNSNDNFGNSGYSVYNTNKLINNYLPDNLTCSIKIQLTK